MNESQLGHDVDVLNEASIQVNGTKHDVDNLVNRSDNDVGNETNNATLDDGDDAINAKPDK